MRPSVTSRTALVKLREFTLALLVMQRRAEDETLDAVIERLARAAPPEPAGKPPHPAVGRQQRRRRAGRRYALTFLGETLCSDTLGGLFAELVDSLAEVDPESVERLAAMRSRRRVYAAREKAAIHPGRPDLRTRRTRSGWWVSANIGTVDLDRAVRAVCQASDLVHGRDIRFVGASVHTSVSA